MLDETDCLLVLRRRSSHVMPNVFIFSFSALYCTGRIRLKKPNSPIN